MYTRENKYMGKEKRRKDRNTLQVLKASKLRVIKGEK